MKKIVIIPAYNEISNIRTTVQDILDHAPGFDYVIINDCSQDGTMRFCTEQGMNIINLPVNLGIGGAVQTGYLYAWRNGYDVAVQFDGDGQHDPKYIANMFETMKTDNADIVIGSRFKTVKKPFSLRMLGSNLISFAIRVTTGGKRIEDVTSGMRLFNKKMIKRFGYNMHYSPEPDTLAYLLNCGVKIEEVQVEMHDRIAGVSYLNFKNSIWYMIKMFFSIFVFQWVRVREREDV